MLNAQQVYDIARTYQAEITAGRQIKWHGTENSPGKWEEILQYRPSVLDSVILHNAYRVPGYLAAAKAATLWSRDMVVGFQQGMLLGRPFSTEEMTIEKFQYWKGLLIALMVVQKLRGEWREAERHFT